MRLDPLNTVAGPNVHVVVKCITLWSGREHGLSSTYVSHPTKLMFLLGNN